MRLMAQLQSATVSPNEDIVRSNEVKVLPNEVIGMQNWVIDFVKFHAFCGACVTENVLSIFIHATTFHLPMNLF